MIGARPCHLQCGYKCMRDGVPVAFGAGASGSDGGSIRGARPHHIQCCHMGIREEVYLWHEALLLLAEMQAQKFESEVINYSAAMWKRMREGSLWHEALELLAEMQAQGLESNVITSSAAVFALMQSATIVPP